MVTSLALALQLAVVPPSAAAPSTMVQLATTTRTDDDSLRDVARAHDAQAGFERGRRYVLPWGAGSGGRCDVRVGRFCWWYEEGQPQGPAEPEEIGRRRAELLAELDALGERRPGDPWIAGMRVYYRVDDRQPALADSVARECRAAGWWCTALRAYAAQARNDVVAADSGFAIALAAMPDSTRCRWTDIRSLLPGDARDRYEHLDCAARGAVESRYWMLATPRLSAAANEWRTEFYGRRVAASLLASAVTPHRIAWGSDTEELLLRYGWPNAWTRIPLSGMPTPALEPDILGHDPSPSFHYGPREALLDSMATALDDGWNLDDVHAESRYAHPAIRRVAAASAQLARFRRADSTLVVAAWATSDDSLRAPQVSLGVLGADGRAAALRADSLRAGRARLTVPGAVRLAGVELLDSLTGSFARSRALFAPRRDTTTILLSDLLVYRPATEEAPTLEGALALAIPGDTAALASPIGLYWEAYGADSAGAEVETTILVERIDRGFVRSFRQRVGLADKDSPVQIRWSESRAPSDGVTSRALSLDLSTVPAGRYRITVALTPATGAGAVAARELELKD
jgi:hypothetical protein